MAGRVEESVWAERLGWIERHHLKLPFLATAIR